MYSCIIALFLLSISCSGKRSWEYEALYIHASTSDESLLEFKAEVVRKGRGSPTISAVLDMHYQIDDTTMMEASIQQSQTGRDDDYRQMPWNIDKQPFPKYLEDFYKDVLYANVGHCSNLVEPGNEIPWPMITYKFENCIITGDGLPEIAPEGYYKVFFNVTGEVDWGFVLGLKIVSKSNTMGY